MTEDEILEIIDRVIGFNSCCGWEKEFAREIASFEREACATLCEELGAEGYGSLYIATAIRARDGK